MEIKPMKTEIEKAIKYLAVKITGDIKGDEAMKLSQAALNLAHTAQVIKQTEAK